MSRMAFIGFDLDETLGRFYIPYGYVSFLMPQAVYTGTLRGLEPFPPSKELQESMEGAFQQFAKCLADKEPALGILRPGILEIMRRFSELKSQGRVKALSVYSNNGNLGVLRLATTMIEYLVKHPGLFCNHIDFFSPIRSKEANPSRPQEVVKTARTLRASFLDPRCGRFEDLTTVPVKDLFFFDDRLHPQIADYIEPSHYFLVKPYKNDASIAEVENCFKKAISDADLENKKEYIDYIAPILKNAGLEPSFQSIYVYLDTLVKDAPLKTVPFLNDLHKINEQLDTVFPLESYGLNYFSVADGGKRSHTRRRRRKISKKRKQKQQHRSTRKN